jgi:hypothetical protein
MIVEVCTHQLSLPISYAGRRGCFNSTESQLPKGFTAGTAVSDGRCEIHVCRVVIAVSHAYVQRGVPPYGGLCKISCLLHRSDFGGPHTLRCCQSPYNELFSTGYLWVDRPGFGYESCWEWGVKSKRGEAKDEGKDGSCDIIGAGVSFEGNNLKSTPIPPMPAHDGDTNPITTWLA